LPLETENIHEKSIHPIIKSDRFRRTADTVIQFAKTTKVSFYFLEIIVAIS
jgi:hypothetical protein